ncbi:unnamed protein product [Periconia digitata]|uniref:Methyltransferase domain-containing protein n=1 Tax=Periconia digitata TaxID=1303443 RepID=A0A9W4UPD0_9PLEO|nr:unnamed protein product [Periconia digitata]
MHGTRQTLTQFNCFSATALLSVKHVHALKLYASVLLNRRMSNTRNRSRQASALARLHASVHPSPRPTYGPKRIDNSHIRRASFLTRFLDHYFPRAVRIDVAWYTPTIGRKLTQDLDFFIEATALEEKHLLPALYELREKMWAVDAYPCYGLWWFVLPGISGLTGWWEEVVQTRAQKGEVVLDMGCGIGQEIRRVAAINGVKPSQLYALDVTREIWNLGLSFFGDAGSPPAEFIHADARSHLFGNSLRHKPERLYQLSGKVDVILMAMFLDLFHFPDQKEVLNTAVALSKIGTQVIGYSRGATTTNAKEGYWDESGTRSMVHDDISMLVLWWDIGKHTNTVWKIETRTVDIEELGWDRQDVSWMGGPPAMGMCFLATRER